MATTQKRKSLIQGKRPKERKDKPDSIQGARKPTKDNDIKQV
jgi:hypothetical protein